MIKCGDLMMHKYTDEIIHVTKVRTWEDFPTLIWVSYENHIAEIKFGKQILLIPCCLGKIGFSLIDDIKKEYVKFGEI
jgi:hypothetical protein